MLQSIIWMEELISTPTGKEEIEKDNNF